MTTIISSPKRRARQTAEIISQLHNLKIQYDDRLIERLEWQEGETFEAFTEEWLQTDKDRSFISRNNVSSSSNGERMRALMDELSSSAGNTSILIVSHGGTIGDALRNVFLEGELTHVYDPENSVWYIDIAECSITRVNVRDGKYHLECVGETKHLH